MTNYYFAYGSNMNQQRMIERGMEIISAEFAILKDYKLVFDKPKRDGSTAANVRIAAGKSVEGTLYKVNTVDMRKLDKFEPGYERHSIGLYLRNGDSIISEIYVAYHNLVMGVAPTKEYISHFLKAEFISEPYRQQLTNLYNSL